MSRWQPIEREPLKEGDEVQVVLTGLETVVAVKDKGIISGRTTGLLVTFQDRYVYFIDEQGWCNCKTSVLFKVEKL